MRASAVSILALMALGACAAVADPPPVPQLQQVWLSEGFEEPEGVALAPDGNYFISSVRGEAGAKDGDGYVSKVSPDGKVLEKYFAAKVNAPKGMAVKDGTLYVADVDEVVTFNAETGHDRDAIRVPGALFLNDMTVWDGKVLVSDSGLSKIVDVSTGAPVTFLEDERLGGVNGLLGDGDRLLVTTMNTGSLLSVSKDGTITEIAKGMANADGVGLVPGGGWLTSSWPGEIHYVAPDGTVTTLLDTQAASTLQNDLTVFGDTVIVPNMNPGTVTAWKIVR